MVFGIFRSIIQRAGRRGQAVPDSMIEQAALQLSHELETARLLLQGPRYEEVPNPTPDELEHGTRAILDRQAARFLVESSVDPMHAVAWLMARNFRHRPVYLNAHGDMWHLGTLSPTYEQWLLLLRKNGRALEVRAADGTPHGPSVALSTLGRVLNKANLAVPEAIQ